MNEDEVQPFLVVAPDKKPNAITREAIKELEEGAGKEFKSVQALFEDLGWAEVITAGSATVTTLPCADRKRQ